MVGYIIYFFQYTSYGSVSLSYPANFHRYLVYMLLDRFVCVHAIVYMHRYVFLFKCSFPGITSFKNSKASLPFGLFDCLSPLKKFVIVTMQGERKKLHSVILYIYYGKVIFISFYCNSIYMTL